MIEWLISVTANHSPAFVVFVVCYAPLLFLLGVGWLLAIFARAKND
jgi:hypothetical protein